MRRLLNTLYITTKGAYLHKDGETVSVRVDGEIRKRFPIHNLEGIVCFGGITCSPFLLHHCAENNVTLSFLSLHGRFLARVVGPVSGNVLLRREQFHRADNFDESADIARSIVMGKLLNSRTVLMRANRDKDQPDQDIAAAVQHLAGQLQQLKDCRDLETIRGIEGEAARRYFSVFDHLILAQKSDFFFHARSRRPPLDNMNGLLSFLYTLLVHDVCSAAESVGLDPQVGYLHKDRPGRPSLALDLMEEFRSFVVDRLALSLINRQQIKGKGFTKTASGAVQMTEETRRAVIVAYQKRKQDVIVHPFIEEKIPVGLLPYVQALLLARHLRGDLDTYPPFIWK